MVESSNFRAKNCAAAIAGDEEEEGASEGNCVGVVDGLACGGCCSCCYCCSYAKTYS